MHRPRAASSGSFGQPAGGSSLQRDSEKTGHILLLRAWRTDLRRSEGAGFRRIQRRSEAGKYHADSGRFCRLRHLKDEDELTFWKIVSNSVFSGSHARDNSGCSWNREKRGWRSSAPTCSGSSTANTSCVATSSHPPTGNPVVSEGAVSFWGTRSESTEVSIVITSDFEAG